MLADLIALGAKIVELFYNVVPQEIDIVKYVRVESI